MGLGGHTDTRLESSPIPGSLRGWQTRDRSIESNVTFVLQNGVLESFHFAVY